MRRDLPHQSRAEQRQNLSPQVIGGSQASVVDDDWHQRGSFRSSHQPATVSRRDRGDGRNDPEPGRPNKRRALRSCQLQISSDSPEAMIQGARMGTKPRTTPLPSVARNRASRGRSRTRSRGRGPSIGWRRFSPPGRSAEPLRPASCFAVGRVTKPAIGTARGRAAARVSRLAAIVVLARRRATRLVSRPIRPSRPGSL